MYFEFKYDVQRSWSANHIADNSDPNTHGEVVKTLDRHYLSNNQHRVPNSDTKVSSTGR